MTRNRSSLLRPVARCFAKLWARCGHDIVYPMGVSTASPAIGTGPSPRPTQFMDPWFATVRTMRRFGLLHLTRVMGDPGEANLTGSGRPPNLRPSEQSVAWALPGGR
jgi:hypothetical protein